MLIGLYIILDDDFEDPIYADPDPEELDGDLWAAACEAVVEALDDERSAHGVASLGEHHLGWRALVRQGLSFVAITTDDLKAGDLDRYLQLLVRRYLDEVDDARNPERAGVEDVVVDVIPPWEVEPE